MAGMAGAAFKPCTVHLVAHSPFPFPPQASLDSKNLSLGNESSSPPHPATTGLLSGSAFRIGTWQVVGLAAVMLGVVVVMLPRILHRRARSGQRRD